MITKEIREIIKKHCLIHNIKYSYISTRISYQLTKKNALQEKTIAELLDFVTERYKYKESVNKINYNINLLKKANSNKEYRDICSNLKINWNHILKLSYRGYDKKQTILYFWYFYDQIKDDKKDLSRKRIFEIKDEKKLTKQDIYYLISYYKCGKKDYLEQILDYEEKYIKRIVSSIAYKFKLSPVEREDLTAEANLILLQIIEKITLNDIRQIISYIRIVLFGSLLTYTKKNYQMVIEFNEEYMYKREEIEDAV